MRHYFVLLILFLAFAHSLVTPLRSTAQEFIPEQVVFRITTFSPDTDRLMPVSMRFGTGFCLDPNCLFVGTNYHVAKLMGRSIRINGTHSTHRYLDSGPNDAGAQEVKVGGTDVLKYNPAHDLAIYEMRRPLAHLHGIGFDSDDDLATGLEIDIYAYPFEGTPKRKLLHWHGRFLGSTPQGLLSFSYEQGRVRNGASGGIVINSKTGKIVGVLCGFADSKDSVVLAVPVQQLSNFVMRTQPYLQATLFPRTVFVSPVAPDLYGPYVWSRDGNVSQRSEEPSEVTELRATAQHLADSMRNFIATQTFAWGHDNGEPQLDDARETLVVDGQQRWRNPGGKKLYENAPLPSLAESVTPGNEWSFLPRMIGTELHLKIHQAADAVSAGRVIHVFQYAAKAEDRVCAFRTYKGLRHTTQFYDCHGEVWTDTSGTILRISESFDLTGPWRHWWAVMTYGWLEKDGRRYRVPVTIATQAEHNTTYWCRGLFTDYEMYGVKVNWMLVNSFNEDEPLADTQGLRHP